jgi:hypothetical protein
MDIYSLQPIDLPDDLFYVVKAAIDKGLVLALSSVLDDRVSL